MDHLTSARPSSRRGSHLVNLRRTGARRALAAVAAASGLALVGTAPAHAADPLETFKNLSTGYCLTFDQAGANALACNTHATEYWYVHHWADGTVRLQNEGIGTCVADVSGDLLMRACDSSEQQSWWVKHYSDGSLRFQNQATGLCMVDLSSGFGHASCNDTTSQRWK